MTPPVEVLRAAAALMRERMDAPRLPSSDVRFVCAVADWLDATAAELDFWGVSEQATLAQRALAVARTYLEEA